MAHGPLVQNVFCDNRFVKHEPAHDKTNKTCVPSKHSDQPGHRPTDQSWLCAQLVAKGPRFPHVDRED